MTIREASPSIAARPMPACAQPPTQPGAILETAPPVPKEAPPGAAALFQAIGTLQGQVEANEQGRYSIKLAGKSYPLFFPRSCYRAWQKQQEQHPDLPLFFLVYPKCLIIPRQEPIIRFEVVAWQEENTWLEAPGMFRFQGIWQFVPQLRTPVISIYRNSNATDSTGKFKAIHLPVLMRRQDDARPFKFNPKVPKENLPPRWFIQARFKFLPSRNCWGWCEDLAPPSVEIPRYRKPRQAS